MSSEIHEIRLIAKDGASAVFRMTGTNAERMNQQIERSNQRTARSYKEITDITRKVAAGVGAMSAASILAANKSEVAQQRLKSTIEATGRSYDEYADKVNRAQKAAIKKAFDDEDAADAMSKLTQATNDAGKAIDDLAIAEDVARARGISLASAADVVAAAEQGRIGALRRMGIAIDENATKEEALAALRTKFAGQADAYAQTNAATWDRARIQAENALESIGGKLAAHQTEILAASAAWSAFGGSIASVAKMLGAGGFGKLLSGVGIAGILGMAGYAAAGGGSSPGTNSFNSLFNTVFGGVAGGLNALLPGNPLNTSKYTNAMGANSIEDAVKGIIYNPQGYGNDAEVLKALVMAGVIKPGQVPLNMDHTGVGISNDAWNNVLTGVNTTASSYGMSPGQYLAAAAKQAGLVQDPVTGMWGLPEQISSMQGRRDSMLGNVGATGPNPPAGWFKAKRPVSGAYGANSGAERPSGLTGANTNAAAGNYPSSSSMGDGLAQQTQALKAQYGEWYKLADGVVTATDAMEGFQLAQAQVLKVEGKYSGELSEFSGQLNALQAAYDEVNKKKESGAQLTQKETEFLDNYATANERLTGGVYDSTLALGIQAEKYASNMMAADEFKRAGDGVTNSIYALIDALYGIPGYVKTTIEADTSNFWAAITPLLGQQIGSAFINVYANRIGFGATPEQHGGLVMAQHGYAGGSRSILVGEAGPEIMTISGGSSYTMPAAASKYSNKLKGGNDGGGMVIHNLTVVTNNPRQFGDQMRAYALGGARN